MDKKQNTQGDNVSQEKALSPQEHSKGKDWLKQNGLPLLLGAGLLLTALFFVYQQQRVTGKQVATIVQSGEEVLQVDLSQMIGTREIQLGDRTGNYNVIAIEANRIAVVEANCPDQICVLQGWSQGEGRPILCLPHQLAITFDMEGGSYDVIVG